MSGMASRPILILGNLTSISLAIVALLQLLSWTIAGLLILATLTFTTLIPGRSRDPGAIRPPSRKSMVQAASVEMKQRERPVEKILPHGHPGSTKTESKPTPRHEPVRTSTLQPRPEPERIPASAPRSSPARPESVKTIPPKIVPPKIVPSTFSPSKPVSPKTGVTKQEPSRPITPNIIPPNSPPPTGSYPGKNPTIGKGDYESYDVELEEGAEVTCTVIANGQVNVYLLDDSNLNGLDAGEEFWSETGEEDVDRAVLSFTAPEKGKWFLVVENVDSKDISATVNIEKGPARIVLRQDSDLHRPVKSGLG